jgi:hypothetical protein
VAAGVSRRFALEVPAKQYAWLFAGETAKDPAVLDAKGAAVAVDLKGDEAEVPAAGRVLVLPQDGSGGVVVELAAAPEAARWHLVRKDKKWQAVVKVPAADKGGKVEVRLNTWVPYRDDAGLLKELLAGK